jgi:hypothetical protein
MSDVRNLVTVNLPRSGLGHCLFSYARAYSYYAEGCAEFVHPIWFRIRLGPYLRREIDKRNYHRVIRRPRGWGLSSWYLLRRWSMRLCNEDTFEPGASGQFLVVTNDLVKHDFSRIEPHRDSFAKALQSISRIPTELGQLPTPSIGIFHRGGDMSVNRPATTDERRLRTHGYGYIPVGYAADALEQVRRIAGWKVPAVLSTDASPAEVEPIMRQGSVSLARHDSALANMLEMSRHAVLIVGTTNYSRWSWFLGDAFAITPKLDNPKILPPAPDRPDSAWFVFSDETSLSVASVAERVWSRLQPL